MTQAFKNRLHPGIRVGTGLVGDERVAVLEGECSRLVAVGATPRAAPGRRRGERVVPGQAGRRGQRVLSGLKGREPAPVLVRPSRWAPGWPRAAVAIGRSVKRPPSAHWLSGRPGRPTISEGLPTPEGARSPGWTLWPKCDRSTRGGSVPLGSVRWSPSGRDYVSQGAAPDFRTVSH